MKKRLALVFIMLLAVIFTLGGCLLDDILLDSSQQIDHGFTVDKVRTTIDIDKDGSAHFTEVLDIRFLDQRRGIVRQLPTGAGESYTKIKVETSSLNVGKTIPNNYFLTTSYKFISINTGTKDSQQDYFFYKGDMVRYTITYKIIPPAKYADNENYYVNILPIGSRSAQKDIEIIINFPSSVEEVFLPYGDYGSTTAVGYKVVGGKLDKTEGEENQINATLLSDKSIMVQSDGMSAFSGITMQAAIKNKLSNSFDLRVLVGLLAALTMVAAIILLKVIYRPPPIVEVVNFNPPTEDGNKLNPAEVGLLIDGTCSTGDITSLIFYWASNGHLQIQSSEKEKEAKKGQNPTLVKLVELPQFAPDYEKKMFAQLFKDENRVSIKSLQNKFYMHISAAQSAVQKKYNGKLHRVGLSILFAALSAAIPALGYLIYGLTLSTSLFLWKGIFVAVPVAVIYFLGITRQMKVHKMTPSSKKTSVIFHALIAAVIGILFSFLNRNALPLLFSMPLNLAAATGAFVASYFLKLTDFYNKILGDLLGFRNFLLHAEKDKLEALLAENPQYYYDILPYANVLGVSDIWEDKFKDLTLQPPTYYYSPYSTVFSLIIFNRLFQGMYSNIRSTAISRPSSSGRSGFGGFGGGGFGGGFSGGGFGGGGLGSR